MKRILFIFFSGLIWSTAANAHSDEYLDTLRAPNGGQLRMAGPYHLELVVKPNTLVLYVTDHGGTEIDTKGANATAHIISGNKEASVRLVPVGKNILKGSGAFSLEPSSKVEVTVRFVDQEPQSANFTPLRKKKAARASITN